MLSPEQQLVVENIDDNNIVVALPGSGKTHTIKYAIDHLLDINPKYKVLVVTFTNAATAEMLGRIRGHISPEKFEQVEVYTFHSLLNKMSKTIDKRRLLIGGAQTSYIIRAMNSFSGPMDFSDAVSIIDFYSAITDLKPTAPYEKSYGLYEEYLRIMEYDNRKDFGVIVRQVILGLREGTLDLAEYTHCLVDEYQDTDDQQLEWLLLHSKQGTKISVVGDDDQSIFSFRSAKGYENFIALRDELNSNMFQLSICRRCAPEILSAASEIIGWNRNRIKKDMVSAKEEGGSFQLAHVDGSAAQYEMLVEHIKCDYEDWAVLSKTNAQLDQVEKLLIANEIPYNRLSGKSFYEHPEVVMQLNLLGCLVHDKGYDYLKTTLGYLNEVESNIREAVEVSRQLGSIKEIQTNIQPHWSLATKEYINLLHRQAGNTSDEERINEKLKMLEAFIHRFKPPKASGDTDARSKDFGFFNALCEIARKMPGAYSQRISNLIDQLNQRKDKKALDKSVVTLSTFHSSKGLEWSRVWLVDVNEGVIPSKEGAIDIDIRDEERRVLYVAMTRAEDELVITSTEKPSTFLTESFPDSYTQFSMTG